MTSHFSDYTSILLVGVFVGAFVLEGGWMFLDDVIGSEFERKLFIERVTFASLEASRSNFHTTDKKR
jgi:hypothetical protein